MSSPPSSPIYAYQDSSPESSPVLDPIDSSPPSSPALQPVSLSPPVSPGPAHPYAASTKAVKQPRLYEKRDTACSDWCDASDVDDEVLGYAAPRRSAGLWGLSPRKRRTSSQSHARTLSAASTSSSMTDNAFGRRIEPRRLLFGPPRSSERSMSTDSRDELAAIDLSDDEGATFKSPVRPRSRMEREKHIWDAAITTAVDTADGLIDLQQEGLISTGLSFIPPTIADLASLVVLPSKEKPAASQVPLITGPRIRPFVRSVTLPGRTNASFLSTPEHPLAKATSMTLRESPGPTSAVPFTNEVNLLLGNNAITKLPVELFSLSNLTILSMRNNSLTHIPPQIAHLTNLRELNVARNKLKYLPAEMLEMQLDVLVVDHNPWLTPTSLDRVSDEARPLLSDTPPLPVIPPPQPEQTEPSDRIMVSATTMNFKLPSLTECCLRVLLTPHHEPSHAGGPSGPMTHRSRPFTRLEAMYELPLPHVDHYPVQVVKTLAACVPAAVARPDPHLQASPSKRARRRSTQSRANSTFSDVFGSNARNDDGDDRADTSASHEETHPGIGTCMSPVHSGLARPVFVDPAEQRFQWVKTIAGRPVHEDVPVLWRGCMAGCLDFLDQQQHSKDSGGGEVPPTEKAACGEHDMGPLESGEGSDDEGVEAIDLGGGLGDEFE